MDYLVKIVVLGAASVGKTSLVQSFVEGDRPGHVSCSIDSEVSTKVIHLKDKILRLRIWDTAGQERFRLASRYQGVHVFMLVFDFSCPMSRLEERD